MVLKDGNKYACESCIRGHRVSGCNHTDRELHFIAPKGRPVKQCDHCRGARKSKSHHAKCDCGGKKDRGEVKLDDKGCCCTLGDNCICGLKNAPDLRIDTNASQARPHLVKGTSESHLTTFINPHLKACHKMKHSTHSAGMPYPTPKTKDGSGTSNTPCSLDNSGQIPQWMMNARSGSKDDSALISLSPGMYTSPSPAQRSVDNLPLSFFDSSFMNSASLDQQYSPADTCSQQFLADLISGNSSTSPTDTLLIQSQATPDAFQSQEEVPGGEHPSFSPADLPLTSNNLSTNFPQPTSFSDESNAQSAPGLTAASSTTHSELGDANALLESGLENTFDANSLFSSAFDLQNVNSFANGSPTAVQKPMQPPT